MKERNLIITDEEAP
jgi:hypothetical protein